MRGYAEDLGRELELQLIVSRILDKVETLEDKMKYLEEIEIPDLKLRLDTAEAEIRFINNYQS